MKYDTKMGVIQKQSSGDLINRLRKVSCEAEKAFASEINFSERSLLSKASKSILEYFDKFKIGPVVLSLLIVFSFPEKLREEIWKGIKRVIRKK